jgi:hypothetical protein
MKEEIIKEKSLRIYCLKSLMTKIQTKIETESMSVRYFGFVQKFYLVQKQMKFQMMEKDKLQEDLKPD